MSRNKMDVRCIRSTADYTVGYIKRVNKAVGEHMITTHAWERVADQSQSVFDNQGGQNGN